MEKDIKNIQNYLMNRLEKLDDDEYMKDNLKGEVARSNATANTALTYVKVINLKLRVNGLSAKERQAIKEISD